MFFGRFERKRVNLSDSESLPGIWKSAPPILFAIFFTSKTYNRKIPSEILSLIQWCRKLMYAPSPDEKNIAQAGLQSEISLDSEPFWALSYQINVTRHQYIRFLNIPERKPSYVQECENRRNPFTHLFMTAVRLFIIHQVASTRNPVAGTLFQRKHKYVKKNLQSNGICYIILKEEKEKSWI